MGCGSGARRLTTCTKPVRRLAMDMFFGLPMHALLVHLAVVAVPVAAVLVVLVAVFPKLPRLVQITTVALSAVSVLLMPMMASSGEALEHRVPDTALVEAHAEMGETLWPWTLGMLLAALGVFVLRRRTRHGDRPVGPGAQTARGGSLSPWRSWRSPSRPARSCRPCASDTAGRKRPGPARGSSRPPRRATTTDRAPMGRPPVRAETTSCPIRVGVVDG